MANLTNTAALTLQFWGLGDDFYDSIPESELDAAADDGVDELGELGLLEGKGSGYTPTPAGMAVLASL